MASAYIPFGDYIKPLASADVFGCNRDVLAYELLTSAGMKDVDLETINKWIDRKLPDNFIKYFTDGVIRVNEVMTYLRSKIGYTWEDLQAKLSHIKDYNIVNCVTDDREVFFQSIVKQLLISLKLEIPADLDAPSLTFWDGVSMTEKAAIKALSEKEAFTISGSCAPASESDETETYIKNK